MQFFDISRSFIPGMAIWPGDTPTEIEQVTFIQKGSSVNISRFTASTHTGTHVDAPSHFVENEKTISELSIEPFWGTVQVVSVKKGAGPLFVRDVEEYDFTLANRILIKTACSHITWDRFPEKITYPAVELVDYSAESGIILFGTDAPSVDALDDPHLPTHKAFLKKGIAILEGLNLKDVPDGIFELAAVPIKIEGADGGPCRAVLRTL